MGVIYSAEHLPMSNAVSIANNRKGFEQLEQRLIKLTSGHSETPVVFAIEASGEYWKPMWNYFKGRGYETVFVPPLFVKRTRDIDDYTPRSNDPKDASRCARLAREGKYYIPAEQRSIFHDLRFAVRTWEQLTCRLVCLRLRIASLLAVYFPEFLRHFSCSGGSTWLALNEKCPFPQDILAMDRAELCQLVIHSSHGVFGESFVDEIRDAAQNSTGLSIGIDGARIRLQVILTELKTVKEQRTKLRGQLTKMLDHIDYSANLLTIPGIGKIGIARFLGHLGDIENYNKVNQILDISGLSLVASESGNYHSQRQISHRGRCHLRTIEYELTCHFIRFPNTARRKYLCCRLNGKNHRQAVVACIPHLLRTFMAVAKQKRVYKPPAEDDPIRSEITQLEHLWLAKQKEKNRHKAA
jgi:transposase